MEIGKNRKKITKFWIFIDFGILKERFLIMILWGNYIIANFYIANATGIRQNSGIKAEASGVMPNGEQ